ncbi:hypothetical protein [Streptomyces sp. NPDC048606]|uniref:hypothetical protein n=1 Tax=Streptomyces sp. NPDC048606 TaxID=3154726 RepID=UPI00342EC3D0
METPTARVIGQLTEYLRELTRRLDPGAGWYGEFLRRDPDGMRACLEGAAIPPWDVLESLLGDLVGEPDAIARETAYAAGLRAAAVAAWDATPGGAAELRTLLHAAAAQRAACAAALRRLTDRPADGDPARAAALASELAWTRDDAARATARHEDLAARLRALAEPLAGVPRQREGAVGRAEGRWLRAGRRAGGARYAGAAPPGAATPTPRQPPAAPLPAPRGARFAPPPPAATPQDADAHASGPAPQAPAPQDHASYGPAAQGTDGYGPAAQSPVGYADASYGAAPHGPDGYGAAPHGPAPHADAPYGAGSGPGGAPYGPDAHGPAPHVPRPYAPAPQGPAPAGAVSVPVRARRDFVAELLALRARGRTGEAHALLCQGAAWPADRLPGLADDLARAGLAADWGTLLWEAASLPPVRLAEAAAALGRAGRTADGDRLLRQGVARPGAEVAEAALALGAAGHEREAHALLAAFVRLRTAEEAAALARHDPRWFAPRLLRAAGELSGTRHRDLTHALRVAGVAGA